MSDSEGNELTRDTGGRFVKGQSGNPAGKAKGVRNEITLMRLTLEKALRDYVGNPANAEQLLLGIDRILEIAVTGEDKHAIAAMKLLLEKVMPSIPPQLSEEAKKTDTKLQIIIQTNPDAQMPVQAVIEGDYIEVDED